MWIGPQTLLTDSIFYRYRFEMSRQSK